MTIAVFVVCALVGGALAFAPLLRRARWPSEPADERDDVARAVSSLRDLEFARAAGTIAPPDYDRLRAALERDALMRYSPGAARTAAGVPIRTIGLAAVLAGIVVTLVAVSLPQEVGDRAPGSTITGTVPAAGPGIAELEARVRATPNDIPTRLALADAYMSEGRQADAAAAYREVLLLDRDNIAALDGIALLLDLAGERDGAMVAVERVLQLRPRDPDALFLKGLIAYQREEWRAAVETWTIFLDVGEFHPAAPMVRPLYDQARRNLTK